MHDVVNYHANVACVLLSLSTRYSLTDPSFFKIHNFWSHIWILLTYLLKMFTKRSVPLLGELPQYQLPTELTVLGHYLWQLKQQVAKRPTRSLAINTVHAVRSLWVKAYIPCRPVEQAMRLLFYKKDSVIKR